MLKSSSNLNIRGAFSLGSLELLVTFEVWQENVFL